MWRALPALILTDLRLALRMRTVVFFNYLFPLMFFFAFAEFLDAHGEACAQVAGMVLVIGILGNGLWGAGMRLVQEREANILRRFRVTPISPTPILLASVVTGWLLYLPALALLCALAHWIYGMPLPTRWVSLLVLTSCGIWAFRAIGLIVASVVNGVQESTVLIQLLYMPMLFLGGAAIPVELLPAWAQVAARFVPSYYLVSSMQNALGHGDSAAGHGGEIAAMLLTTCVGLFISRQAFRWEKDDPLSPRARWYLAAVLAPFLLLGIWQLAAAPPAAGTRKPAHPERITPPDTPSSADPAAGCGQCQLRPPRFPV